MNFGEGLFCREIFPIEIWEIILGHITALDDLFHCSRVCRDWETIVFARVDKIVLLLPQVLPILKTQRFVKNADILKCRLASKSWKDAVDTTIFHEDWFNDYIIWNNRNFQPSQPYSAKSLGTRLGSESDMFKFIEDMATQKASSNPFVCQTLLYSPTRLDSQQEVAQFYATFRVIGVIFGSHIQSIIFVVVDNVVAYAQIKYILQRFPNLRRLKLIVNTSGIRSEAGRLRYEQTELEELRKLQNFQISETNLTHLSISCLGHFLMPQWIRTVIECSPRLETLACWMGSPDRHSKDEWMRTFSTNSNIRELTLDGMRLNIATCIPPEFEWHVRKLTICLGNDYKGQLQSYKLTSRVSDFVSNFFLILRQLSTTLEEFVFRVYGLRCSEKKYAVQIMHQTCSCNETLTNDTSDIGENPIKANALKVLSVSHAFLHPVLFHRLMEACPALKELRINDLDKIKWSSAGKSISEREVRGLLLEVLLKPPQLPNSMQRITVERWGVRRSNYVCTRNMFGMSETVTKASKRKSVFRRLFL